MHAHEMFHIVIVKDPQPGDRTLCGLDADRNFGSMHPERSNCEDCIRQDVQNAMDAGAHGG